ncbi:hypothetical protein ACFODO_16120, partial [Acinetobacter sichuanensis]
EARETSFNRVRALASTKGSFYSPNLNKIPFYTFKKLLKAFRPPSSPYLAMLSDFKKLQMPDIKLQMPDKTDL